MRPAPNKSGDESTQTLLGTLPILLAPQKEKVAIIGFGSGMTTHSVLASNEVKHVDTIEIEPSMVKAARLFHEKTYRAFDDPRSNIIHEDAKTFFAVNKSKYDVIIAEPSNPWVSGVSSLFTTEFYDNTNKYLNEEGVFAQWVQTYELSPPLLASIANALGENFSHYDLYAIDENDLLFIASSKPLKSNFNLKQTNETTQKMLARFGITEDNQLSIHKLGSKNELSPLFKKISSEINSNFKPIVDQQAVKSRFLSNSSNGITHLRTSPVPVQYDLINLPTVKQNTKLSYLSYSQDHGEAQEFYSILIKGKIEYDFPSEFYMFYLLTLENCPTTFRKLFLKKLPRLFKKLSAFLTAEQLQTIWPKVSSHPCLVNTQIKNNDALNYTKKYLQLYENIANRNHIKILKLGSALILLEENKTKSIKDRKNKGVNMSPLYLKRLWLWSAILSKTKVTPPFKIKSIYSAQENKNWISHLLELKFNALN